MKNLKAIITVSVIAVSLMISGCATLQKSTKGDSHDRADRWNDNQLYR